MFEIVGKDLFFAYMLFCFTFSTVYILQRIYTWLENRGEKNKSYYWKKW